MNFNKIILAGNLTRDPQTSYLPSQTPVADFGLAINRKWKSQEGQVQEETCFVECRAFGKLALNIVQYVKKGSPILVEGRLKLEVWTDKNTQQKRSRHSVVVERSQFLGTNPQQATQGQQPQGQPQGQPQQQYQQQPAQGQLPYQQQPSQQPAQQPPAAAPDYDDIPF